MKSNKNYEKNNISDIYDLISSLIYDNKITFNYYNSAQRIEPIQICCNKKEQIIEIVFRNYIQEHINELRALNEQYEKIHK